MPAGSKILVNGRIQGAIKSEGYPELFKHIKKIFDNDTAQPVKNTISIPADKTIDIIDKYNIHSHPDKPSYNHKDVPYYVFRGHNSMVDNIYTSYKTISINPNIDLSELNLNSEDLANLKGYIDTRKQTIGFTSDIQYVFYFLHKVYSLTNSKKDKSLQGFYYSTLSNYVEGDFKTVIEERNDFVINNNCNDEYESVSNETINIGPKYKEIITKARIGQGAYRDKLINKYGCKCMLCNISVKQMLIASHIKEFSESTKQESLDVNNGLLLCANHDKLFDQHLISFDNQGMIMISEELKNIDLDKININQSLQIDTNDQIENYMSFHREKLR